MDESEQKKTFYKSKLALLVKLQKATSANNHPVKNKLIYSWGKIDCS